MIKRYLLYILLGLVVLPACGQGVADYYRLPDRSRQYSRLLTRYGGPYIRDRWYIALDGFLRTDRAHLDNSFNGLIESDRVAKFGGSVVIGWAYRERWMVEAGYARMPLHSQVSVSNANSPLVFRYTNDRNALIIRGKRLILSTSGPWLRSGFWLSGGVGLVPNNGQQEGRFSLIGYRYHGRGETPDTLRLISSTQTNSRATILAELGAEYNVRLSNNFDLGFSARKFWGLGNSLTTDVTYSVNRKVVEQAQLQGSGTGMSYGVTLRYTYAMRRNLSNVLELNGKHRNGQRL
ncbi:hypothetical protein ACFSUS_27650 [Spirosoma soli]|uniref:DUF481 domain-containing protein n=1 Tax=Spirosoma soli TaxID=1770529 RepID=A0ABW5MD75_9BACT